jgi:hypothetical protein
MVKKHWSHGIKLSCLLTHQSYSHSYLATWQEVDVSILILRVPTLDLAMLSFGRRTLNKNTYFKVVLQLVNENIIRLPHSLS